MHLNMFDQAEKLLPEYEQHYQKQEKKGPPCS